MLRSSVSILNPPFRRPADLKLASPSITDENGFQPRLPRLPAGFETVIRSGSVFTGMNRRRFIYAALACGRNPRANAGGQSFNASPSAPNLNFADPFILRLWYLAPLCPSSGHFKIRAPMVRETGNLDPAQRGAEHLGRGRYQGTHSVMKSSSRKPTMPSGDWRPSTRRPFRPLRHPVPEAGGGSSYNALEMKSRRGRARGLSGAVGIHVVEVLDYVAPDSGGFGGDGTSNARFV